MANEFQHGNKTAEKWTEQRAVSVLNRILEILWKCDATGERGLNPVRANTIKFRKEICLLVGITERQWQYIKKKFAEKTSSYFSEEIYTILEKIEETCECRLIYSATPMDIFILKTHYGFKNKTAFADVKSFSLINTILKGCW